MKIKEASEDFTKGGILIPGPKKTYMEANTQKDEETKKKGLERTHMRLRYISCAYGMGCITHPCA